MGKMIRSYITGIRCDVKRCEQTQDVFALNGDWYSLSEILAPLVAQGWGFLLPGRLLAYCPAHIGQLSARCRCTRVKTTVCQLHHTFQEYESVVWTPQILPARLMTGVGGGL